MAPTDPAVDDAGGTRALAASLRPTGEPRMGRRAADMAAVCWAAFLAACLGSLVAFAIVDPARVSAGSAVAGDLDRMTGYGVGFLFFWAIGAVAGGLTVLLVRTSRRDARARAGSR